MRFGILLISAIRPKCLRIRFRPVNDCVIAVIVYPVLTFPIQLPPPGNRGGCHPNARTATGQSHGSTLPSVRIGSTARRFRVEAAGVCLAS
jgi:hypothetical protein